MYLNGQAPKPSRAGLRVLSAKPRLSANPTVFATSGSMQLGKSDDPDDDILYMEMLKRLVRFLAKNGRVYYGDAILPRGVTDIAKTKQARIIAGDIFGKHEVTDKIADVRLLLAPLALEDVKTVRCLGLNYALHAKESKLPIPKYPVLFCNDVPESKALDYVLGYAVGNDVSQREWQIQRGGGQWSLGKGFDGWAPYGPGIVSPELIKDPQGLRISTKLNGETVQESNTEDMIFNVKQAISFLSRGTTLLPGDFIFTGTPSGVGMGREPKLWMKDGDVVEVALEGVELARISHFK
ncbi:hypothetical protein DL762_010138 [Monosporascus cannonballus]|uniref:Fumarylacetoacetase-like C-terminal domain-containing protein n=1 Tax=Monosporascus cannonballus TaxID=155416 RepID=A0ABY0GRJ7_9PEZI|nr:hypothetical protein DL762_010138 [Monosporascus cannonballus]